jgi:hypothetical protein
MSFSPKRLVIYSPQHNHTVETLLRLWALSEQAESLILEEPHPQAQNAEHTFGIERVKFIPRIRFQSLLAAPEPSDCLLIGLQAGESALPASLAGWAKVSQQVWFLSELESRHPRYWLREWQQAGKWKWKWQVRGVITCAPRGFPTPWFFKKRVCYPNYIHPQFLGLDAFGEAMNQALARPLSRSREDFVFTYLGSATPEKRFAALQTVRQTLAAQQIQVTENPDYQSLTPTAFMRYYAAPPGHATSSPLAPPAYLAVLARSIFTLCPNGWDNYSHRVVEALACGSIPILPAPVYRYLGLQHGVNCLEVIQHQWEKAIHDALALSMEKRAFMQQSIQELRSKTLPPPLFAQKIWNQIIV